MIKTSTLTSLQSPQLTKEAEAVALVKKEHETLPEFEGPSEASINNILNYSKSLSILESAMVKEIEIVKS